VLYQIPELPQIPSLQRWSPGMSTAEIPGAVQNAHGIFADDGRMMVFMTHNTDIADGFEREADLPAYFESFAARAYALGINLAIWVMTR
jgi:hypothetical protein